MHHQTTTLFNLKYILNTLLDWASEQDILNTPLEKLLQFKHLEKSRSLPAKVSTYRQRNQTQLAMMAYSQFIKTMFLARYMLK